MLTEINLLLRKRDWIVLLVTTLAIFGLLITGWLVAGTLAVGLVLSLGIVFILFLLLQNRREVIQNRRADRRNFEQVEDLMGIYFSLSEMLSILPKTRGVSASPDLLRVILKKIREKKPSLVVEMGSGSSTVFAAYALKKIGCGRIVSLEHIKEYALKSQRIISNHQIEEYAKVIHSPIEDYEIKGETWKWYSTERFNPKRKIDLVIVDGPPNRLQEMSRYPAFPILRRWLSDDATLILDDADRKEESLIVEKWLEENPELTSEYFDTEGGTYVLSTS